MPLVGNGDQVCLATNVASGDAAVLALSVASQIYFAVFDTIQTPIANLELLAPSIGT
jgi:hypothetical protein